jgi:DNA-binding CsgD family transcriptional regulator
MGTVNGGAAPTDLASRPVGAHDIDACLALLRHRAAYPASSMPLIARAWRVLMDEGALIASVVEGALNGGPRRVLSFGASVVVRPEWATAAIQAREPRLALRTIRAELHGQTPILRPHEIDRAPALTVLVLHYGEDRSLSSPAAAAVRYRTFGAFLDAHRGLPIDCVIQEFWDELDPEFILNGWGRVLNDYGDYWQGVAPGARSAQRPYLIGLTRRDVEDNPGNIAGPLFVYVPPRLGLSQGEQRLLQRALAGRTDIELAHELGVALSTVKSRWRSIYDRVGRELPELTSAPAGAARPRLARGREKRRRLLAYLRDHPEELRPGAAGRIRRSEIKETSMPIRSPSIS